MNDTVEPTSSPRSGRGLLGWLSRGFGADQDHAGTEERSAASALRPADPAGMLRRALLADITTFLTTHDLEVTTFTLAIAHDYLTAADSRLVRKIDGRITTRLPIDIAWLEQISGEALGDEQGATDRLMNRLERSLDDFSHTARAAKSAAHDYSHVLESHVEDLEEYRSAQSVVSELAILARAMLERTRALEKEMARSDLQTRTLRRSLDAARRSAEEDPLTGLPNRRAFEARFATEYAEAQASGERLCVAFCDIDHFKRINDTHGHDAGDRVLRTVAQALSRMSDHNCHVARHGGEEFVILLRGHTPQEAWELLDDARARMAERRLVNRATDQPFGRLTFSGGVADVFAYADASSALRAADEALYQAKDEGRNRVILASAQPRPHLQVA